MERSSEYDRCLGGQLTLPATKRANGNAKKNPITSCCRSSDGSRLLRTWGEADRTIKIGASDREARGQTEVYMDKRPLKPTCDRRSCEPRGGSEGIT